MNDPQWTAVSCKELRQKRKQKKITIYNFWLSYSCLAIDLSRWGGRQNMQAGRQRQTISISYSRQAVNSLWETRTYSSWRCVTTCPALLNGPGLVKDRFAPFHYIASIFLFMKMSCISQSEWHVAPPPQPLPNSHLHMNLLHSTEPDI